MVLTAKDAIARHMKWKMLFHFVIERKEELYPETLDRIFSHNACPIGAWLQSDKLKPQRALPEYLELHHAHVAFHAEMRQIATAINEHRYERASELLRPGLSYAKASNQIAMAIVAFDRVHRIQMLAP